MESKHSTSWKSSIQPRKQHKYRFNAPLHIRQSFMHVHLSPELRKKHNKRATQIRKGDTVKVLRGEFSGKIGKVTQVLLKKEKVLVEGIEVVKKDGSKIVRFLHPSNLMITNLDLSDKKRKQNLEVSKK